MGNSPSTPISTPTNPPPNQRPMQLPPDHPRIPTSDSSSAGPESACPVDHKAREAWMQMAQSQSQPSSQPEIQQQTDNQLSTSTHSAPTSTPISSSSEIQIQNQPQQRPSFPYSTPFRPRMTNTRLRTDREISTIPRAGFSASDLFSSSPSSSTIPTPSTTTSPPLNSPPNSPPTHPTSYPQRTTASASHGYTNNETPTSDTSTTGNWIYPSEEQFFQALRRKNFNARAEDMASIIPIHNAVNERAWREILVWERLFASSLPSLSKGTAEAIGVSAGAVTGAATDAAPTKSPALLSFRGDSSKLTPRARWNTFLGYERPFDRHDWVVERADSTIVEYVIDFYAGKESRVRSVNAGEGGVGAGAGAGAEGEGGGKGATRMMGPSFYLDVRPKLNSWEGVRMRVVRALGFGGGGGG